MPLNCTFIFIDFKFVFVFSYENCWHKIEMSQMSQKTDLLTSACFCARAHWSLKLAVATRLHHFTSTSILMEPCSSRTLSSQTRPSPMWYVLHSYSSEPANVACWWLTTDSYHTYTWIRHWSCIKFPELYLTSDKNCITKFLKAKFILFFPHHARKLKTPVWRKIMKSLATLG